jgi:hypothetical protein
MENEILENYKELVARATKQADYYQQQANRYSLFRLGLFGFLIILLVLAATERDYLLLAGAVVIFIAAFAWLVSKQNYFDTQARFFKDVQLVNQNEIGSITARTNIYENGADFVNEQHTYTSDLDIFGQASLYQLINRCASTLGNSRLANWLDAPAPKDVVLARQNALQELAANPDWKQDFQANLLFALKEDRHQITKLSAYLRLPVTLEHQQWLAMYVKFGPLVLLAAFFAGFFNHTIWYLAAPLGLFNNRLTANQKHDIEKADLIAGRIGKVLGKYALTFAQLENKDWQSPLLQSLALNIRLASGKTISGSIKQLSTLIDKLNYRLNIAVSIVLNICLLWDVKQVMAIENWKEQNHESLDAAFEVIAEFEALLSLTSLAINYPAWAFPRIADNDGYTLTASQVAHPLISKANRIANDFELNNAFKIDIITGSNMAGKSTFLRTLGINTVLALSGAPVCAQAMEVSVMTTVTYMRIKDSLNESTSTFKAELDRLKMLLSMVKTNQKVYFLIDEMLRGTNSVDKYKGSKAVIEQLIKLNGVGLVATHDLQISLLEQQYPTRVRNFYFDIQVVNDEMLFDYKIKDGECKTFNASLLLKQIGIEVD